MPKYIYMYAAEHLAIMYLPARDNCDNREDTKRQEMCNLTHVNNTQADARAHTHLHASTKKKILIF